MLFHAIYVYELILSIQQLFEELQVFSVLREWNWNTRKLKIFSKITQLVCNDADN